MKNKPKTNQPFTPKEIQKSDLFLTPFGGIDLIVPYLPKDKIIYDPCCGDNKYKMILFRLYEHGYKAIGSDLRLSDTPLDIFDVKEKYPEYLDNSDICVLNPFFSGKKKIYELLRFDWQKPFAMILPAEFNGWLLNAMLKDGCKWVIPNRRINFITPDILFNIKWGELLLLVQKNFKEYKKWNRKKFLENQFLVDRMIKEFQWKDKHNYTSIFEVENNLLAKYSSAQFHTGWLTFGLDVPEKLTIVDFEKEQQTNMIKKLK